MCPELQGIRFETLGVFSHWNKFVKEWQKLQSAAALSLSLSLARSLARVLARTHARTFTVQTCTCQNAHAYGIEA